MINAGLETKWLEETADPESSLNKPFSCKQRAIGTIKNAKVKRPQILIEASHEEALQGVLYMLCFQSGELEVCDSEVTW
jgi:hypothetical protein